jgi:hypothetical protein
LGVTAATKGQSSHGRQEQQVSNILNCGLLILMREYSSGLKKLIIKHFLTQKWKPDRPGHYKGHHQLFRLSLAER